MKVSFDLDGTLFGVFGPYLINVYDDYVAKGYEVGILTGRCMFNPVDMVQAEVKRIGIKKWDFWYDATMMSGLEKTLVQGNILELPPEQRISVHMFKNRMIRDTKINLHFDDEARFMRQLDSQVPVFDVTQWGGEMCVNRKEIRV